MEDAYTTTTGMLDLLQLHPYLFLLERKVDQREPSARTYDLKRKTYIKIGWLNE